MRRGLLGLATFGYSPTRVPKIPQVFYQIPIVIGFVAIQRLPKSALGSRECHHALWCGEESAVAVGLWVLLLEFNHQHQTRELGRNAASAVAMRFGQPIPHKCIGSRAR